MNSQTNVRMPLELKKEAEKLVKKGYYKSISELVVSSVRNEILRAKAAARKEKEVELVRKARQKVWKEFLDKAGGDIDKAFDLMKKEAEKIYNKNPDFWE